MAELPGSTHSHISAMKNRFFFLLYIAFCAALFIGCGTAEKVTTTKIKFAVGTNTFSVSNPKDTEIEKLHLLPNGGLMLEGYKSRVNSAALEANREQYRFSTELFGKTIQQNQQMLEWLMRGGAQAYGFNLPQGPAATQPPFQLNQSAFGSAPQGAPSMSIPLDKLPPALVQQLNAFVQSYQATNSPPAAQPK